MAETQHSCRICGREAEIKGSLCPCCQESIRLEAMAKRDGLRHQAEKEMATHGVNPGRQKPRPLGIPLGGGSIAEPV